MSAASNQLSFAPGGSSADPLPSVAELLRESRRTEPPASAADGRGARAPLSFAQQRLWFLGHFEELGSAYHLSRYNRLQGALDDGALAGALVQPVIRHSAEPCSTYRGVTRHVRWSRAIVEPTLPTART